MPHFPQSKIDIRPFQDLVRDRGDWVLWQPATPCSCGVPPRADCVVCLGVGVVYHRPQKRIRVVITDATEATQLTNVGLAAPGDLLMSMPPPPPLIELGKWDRIVPQHFVDGQPFVGQRVIRADYGPDALDWLPKRILDCIVADPETGTITAYAPGTDFTTAGHLLTWLPGRGPRVGDRYAIKYEPSYEYVVWDSPVLRYERKTDLGARVILKQRHLVLAQLRVEER